MEIRFQATRLAERPQQAGAVAAAGVDQAAGEIAEQGEEIERTEIKAAPRQRPGEQGRDQPAKRNEYQRVGEVSPLFSQAAAFPGNAGSCIQFAFFVPPP
jgi:hypothetical protein